MQPKFVLPPSALPSVRLLADCQYKFRFESTYRRIARYHLFVIWNIPSARKQFTNLEFVSGFDYVKLILIAFQASVCRSVMLDFSFRRMSIYTPSVEVFETLSENQGASMVFFHRGSPTLLRKAANSHFTQFAWLSIVA